jgi:hypothetical protein
MKLLRIFSFAYLFSAIFSTQSNGQVTYTFLEALTRSKENNPLLKSELLNLESARLGILSAELD